MKQSKCLPNYEQIKKMLYVSTVLVFSSFKGMKFKYYKINEPMKHAK